MTVINPTTASSPITVNDTIKKVRQVTLVGLVLNLLLAGAKGAGGVLFASQALLADAVHSLSDLATDLAVIFGVKYWSAPPDAKHPYGHGKIETLITAFIGLVLIVVALGLTWDAIETLRHGTEKKPELLAFFIATFSIVSKEILYQWTLHQAAKLKSAAMRANAWHHRSDAISSLPVAVAILLSNHYPHLHFVDPVGAILVSFFILHAAWTIIKPALRDLSEAGALDKQLKITEIAESMPGIKSVHAVRARNMGTTYYADLHVTVDPDLTVKAGHEIAHEVKQKILAANIEVSDVIVHIEPYEH